VTVRTWGIYSIETGLLRSCYTGPEATIQEQLREGEAAIEGEFDTALHRVNPKTLEVEDVVPDAPGPGHLWDGRRWIREPAAAAAAARKAGALARIKALEEAQARPLREYALGVPGAKDRITAIDAEIAELRGELVEGQPTGRP